MVKKILIIGLVFVCACTQKENPNATAKERYDNAMELFLRKKYEKAREKFNAASFFLTGTELGDDARYFVAESYFLEEEFTLAIGEYETLIYRFPNSDLIEKSRYKIAICRFEISPKYQLDQGETYLALNALYEFLEEYPQSTYSVMVKDKIKILRERLAQKYFETGQLYVRLEEWKSADIYFSQIIEKFYDTSYFELAVDARKNAQYMLNSR